MKGKPMADEPEMPPAYKAIHATCKKLLAKGIEPRAIVDALLVIGLNHANRISGKKGDALSVKKDDCAG